MIEPTVPEVLAATITTIERDIAPKVSADDDGYTASLCRTVAQLLRMVRSRVEHEEAALTADNAELRALLATWSSTLPDEPRRAVEAALRAAGEVDAPTTVGRLGAEARCLRSALDTLIAALPDRDDPARAAGREYLRHQLERQRPWLVDAFTGPRR